MTDLIRELRRHARDYASLVHGPLCGEAADEIERLRKLAKELSGALLTVRPLGGSELFKRHGDAFYADPLYCSALIREMRDELHNLKCEAVRAGKIDTALALTPANSREGA